jgi:TfoX/Sxy family transcriptional regulator of competence genes
MIYYTEAEGKELREAFEREVLRWEDVETRRMFGCPAYLADGKLFAFLVSEGIVITQIRKHDRQALSEDYETEPFQAGEREISRWLKVTVDGLDRLDRVLRMVEKSYQTVLRY